MDVILRGYSTLKALLKRAKLLAPLVFEEAEILWKTEAGRHGKIPAQVKNYRSYVDDRKSTKD